MAKKEQPLTCTFFVGGVPVEKISSEQAEKMARRIGAAMSIYYTQHPDEYQKLKSSKTKAK